MTNGKRYVPAFLAMLFMTGFLMSASATAAEKPCVDTNHIESLSEDEYFMLYES